MKGRFNHLPEALRIPTLFCFLFFFLYGFMMLPPPCNGLNDPMIPYSLKNFLHEENITNALEPLQKRCPWHREGLLRLLWDTDSKKVVWETMCPSLTPLLVVCAPSPSPVYTRRHDHILHKWNQWWNWNENRSWSITKTQNISWLHKRGWRTKVSLEANSIYLFEFSFTPANTTLFLASPLFIIRKYFTSHS